MNSDKRRRLRKATSDAIKRSAEQRTCPACLRKGALLRHMNAALGTLVYCRFSGCDYERLVEPEPSND